MRPILVGRGSELAALAGCLTEATAHRPLCVLVEGTGGVGKTALVQGFTAVCGDAVFWATGDEAETGLPYGVFDELSRQLTAGLTDVPDQAQEEPGLRDPLTEGAAFIRKLDRVQQDAPHVLVVDDAHLADGPSLVALTFALRRLRTDQVLALVTSRPEGIPRLPPGLLRLVADRGVMMPLGGLSTEEVALLGEAVGFGSLSKRGADRMREHTGGNPLHLRALMAEVTLDQVEAADIPLPAPHSLSLLVLARLGEMSDGAQQLAAAAAVLRSDAALNDLAVVAQVHDPMPGVEELQRAGILVVGEGPEVRQIAFVHPLIRTAVYNGIGCATRAALHRCASAQCTGEESLHHQVSAAVGPEPALAIELAQQGDYHRHTGSWRLAADALFAAARLSGPGSQRDRLFLDAVELRLLDGDLVDAVRHANRIAALPRDAHRVQVQARIAWLSGNSRGAEALAQDAWNLAGDLLPQTRDDVAAMLAEMAILRSDGAGAASWALRALASGLLSKAAAAATRSTGAIGLALTGHSNDGMQLLQDLPMDTSMLEPERRPELCARGMLRLWIDDLTGARVDLRASVTVPERDRRRGLEPFGLVALGYLGETEYRLGDWDAASAISEQAVSLVEDTGQAWLLTLMHALAVLVPAGQGQWVRAEEHLAAARLSVDRLEDQANHAYVDNAAVHLAACRGDAAGVVDAARWLLSDARGSHEPGFLGWSVQHAGALVELGRFEEAAERVGHLQEIAEGRQHRPRLAALARVRGELAAAQRKVSQARAAFEDALLLGEGTADALEAAVLYAAYGRFLRRRGERRSAVKRLSSARDMFAAMGAEPFVSRCNAELAACGQTRVAGAETAAVQLTPQELAVARQVCAGLSNREVADELVLSVKTVGYHLGNVYAKLGVRSRTQLVTRLAHSQAGTEPGRT